VIKAVKRGAALTRSVAHGLWSDRGSLGQKAVRAGGTSGGRVTQEQPALGESLECWVWPFLLTSVRRGRDWRVPQQSGRVPSGDCTDADRREEGQGFDGNKRV